MKKMIFGFLAMIVSLFTYAQSTYYEVAMEINPQTLAAEHNRILKEVHQLQAKDRNLSASEAIRRINHKIPNENVLNETINYFTTNTDTNKMIEMVLTNMKTDDGREILKRIDEIANNYGDNYKKLNELTLIELAKAEKKLDTFDLKVVQIFGYTCIASSDYWNYDFPRMGLSNSSNNTSRRSVRQIVRTDGAAVSAAFIGWAILTVAFPPAAAVTVVYISANLAASVAVGGALGSIISG